MWAVGRFAGQCKSEGPRVLELVTAMGRHVGCFLGLRALSTRVTQGTRQATAKRAKASVLAFVARKVRGGSGMSVMAAA